MKVFIDANEQKKIEKLQIYFEKKKYLFPTIDSLEVKHLTVSDICSEDGRIGIERKSSKDFLQSVFSGRLKKQLFELRTNFPKPFLLVEDYDGLYECASKHPEIEATTLIGIITSAIAHSGVYTYFVGPFYVPFVFSLIEKHIDGGDKREETLYTPIRRTTIKKDYQLSVLLGLPHIQRKRALKLLSAFNYSLKDIMSADIEELKKVDGIGEKIAKEIYDVLQ